MNKVVRYALAVLATSLCVTLTVPTRAEQQPTAGALAAAKELVDIIGLSRGSEGLIGEVVYGTASTFLSTDPRLAGDIGEIYDILIKEYFPRSAELTNEIIKLFATRLTEKELKDVLAFYKSPIGVKFKKESEAIQGETMERAKVWAQKFREEVAARFREELKKRGHNL